MVEGSLPEELHDLFWEYDIGDIDTTKHIGLIVEKVTNHGDVIHIRKFLQLYTDSQIRDVIIQSEFRGMNAKNVVFWSTLLQIPKSISNKYRDRCLHEPWSFDGP